MGRSGLLEKAGLCKKASSSSVACLSDSCLVKGSAGALGGSCRESEAVAGAAPVCADLLSLHACLGKKPSAGLGMRILAVDCLLEGEKRKKH